MIPNLPFRNVRGTDGRFGVLGVFRVKGDLVRKPLPKDHCIEKAKNEKGDHGKPRGSLWREAGQV